MKTLIFLCLPKVRQGDHFAGMMPMFDLEDAKMLQGEIGGQIRIMQIYFN